MDATPVASRDAVPPPTGGGSRSLLLEHVGAILMALADFVLFQTVATLLCAAIYFTIPALDASIRQDGAEWRWIDIFRIVSPTFTVSGGAITVLTSYFFARKSQEESRLRQEAEQQRHEETRRRQEAEQQRQEEARLRQEAEAQVQTLKAQLEQATSSPRRNRRRLRNGAPRSGQ